MTNLERITAKIFGETATAAGDDPQIGQFGSALAGTYVGTTNVDVIQSLPAWSNGFIDSVTPNEQFPPLPEMTGFGKVLSHQIAYTLQKGIPEWDSGTTYYKGDFAKEVGEGKLYVSKVDSNTNNALTDPTYWEEFSSGGSGHDIGEIVASTIPLTNAGLHLLDGELIQGNGIYSAFVIYIAGLVSTYPDLFCTENEWQTAINTYGVCGKFVYDATANTVRLPKITGIIEGTTNINALGDLVEAGLPNIIATWGSFFEDQSEGYKSTGAVISTKESSYYMEFPNMAGGGRVLRDFDASRSSSVYGNSTTVQPQTIKAFYYIVIATSTKTDIQVDIDEIATDLNSKVDKSDLAEIQCVVETYSNGTSWYRVYSDRWCEQGGISNSSAVSFLKNYIDTNYNTSVSWLNMVSGSGQSLCVLDKTVSSMSVQVKWTTDNSVSTFTDGTFNWQACGYIEV